MGRKKKPFERPSEKLDSSLIVIATEGRKTEKNYFDDLKDFYLSKKIHVVIIPNEDDKSDPQNTLKRLDGFYQKYQIGEKDELFLVIDRDRWPETNLLNVFEECQLKEMTMCLSNPCFELWLLLHEKDVSECPGTEKTLLFENKKENKLKRSKTFLDKKLMKYWGGYSKTKKDFSFLMGKVNVAIKNARKLDLNPRERWQNHLGTRVYLIAEKIVDLMGKN